MRRRYFLVTVAAGVQGIQGAPVSFDWSGLSHSLSKYVAEDGKIRYAALKLDLEPLSAVVDRLKTFDAETLPSRHAKLAHWINVYNSLILWSFANDYPAEKHRLKNPLKRANYFYRRKFAVGGRERSLADIEDNSLRKAFSEPRIHFAIVCASTSCPWLSRIVYTESNVEDQLEREAKRFIGQSRNVTFDPVRKTATVTEIFKWFKEDFGGNDASVLRFLAKYSPNAKLDSPGWKLRYFPYDWSLNEATS